MILCNTSDSKIANSLLEYQTFSTSSENESQARMKTERRRHTRINLRLPVLLLQRDLEEPLRCETTDISNHGFYFTTPVPLNLGDKINCLITLPGHVAGAAKEGLLLNCNAEVVRVVARAEVPGFGIGCRITEYEVIPAGTIQTLSH